MSNEVGQRRVGSQGIAPTLATVAEVVGRLGAVQAQDYLGALWAIGARLPAATEQDVEQAISERTIVRTWPMRGTIHFVPAADVRWMQEAMTPRIVRGMEPRLRGLDLDAATLSRSADILGKALEGGNCIARADLYAVLEQHGIVTGNGRGLHILGYLSNQQLLCFGPRQGKQPTFTLLHEWVPHARSLPHDEALATLAQRYFAGHGPATLQDFVWWTGLPVASARAGVQAAAPDLHHEQIDGQDFYSAANAPRTTAGPQDAFLLPPFDEFLVAYRDRSAVIDGAGLARVVPGSNGIFHPIIVIDGRVVGTWKRTIKRNSVAVTLAPFGTLSAASLDSVAAAVARYGQFLGLAATLHR